MANCTCNHQNHPARHSERGKKTRQTEEEVGRQHQGMDRPGVRQVPEGSGEQGKIEKTGCKIICGASTALTVKGLMMMMMKKVLGMCRDHVDETVVYVLREIMPECVLKLVRGLYPNLPDTPYLGHKWW